MSLYLFTARKGLCDNFAHNAVNMCARVVADRLHFRCIGLAVRKRHLFNRAIENPADNIAIILVQKFFFIGLRFLTPQNRDKGGFAYKDAHHDRRLQREMDEPHTT